MAVALSPAPRIASLNAHALRRLRELLPPDRLLTDPSDCLVYGYDNSRRIALPQAVAMAAGTEEIQPVVAVCNEFDISLVVRGRGTNTTGAAVPVAGGIVLSLERMNRILRCSAADRMLECEAGALNGEVQSAASAHRLFWAPDPTSAGYSSVGGNLACNAGGPRAVKYGTARDNVLGLSAITGAGQAIHTGTKTTKGVVGYDLTRLLCGSEGTLAIITRATLKLLPALPARRTLRALYRDVPAAAAAVARIMSQADIPCALEFFDGDAVRLAQQYRDCGLSSDAGALLLIDIDGHAEDIGRAQQAVADSASGAGMIELRAAATAEEANTLWAARKALSPALRGLAPKKVNEDVAVPVSRLPELVSGVHEISGRHALRIVCFGHAGNGNLHVNLLADPEDPTQMKAIEAALHEVFRLVLALEGTISGEHGVGIEKRDYVGWEIDRTTLQLMRDLKKVFDPKGILNPGKALPPE